MGGAATFAGTNHQAGVIAFAFVHVLTQRRLGWITPLDDTPVAVSAETGGPGDDVSIECGNLQSFEVQAKAGLTGAAQLDEAISEIVSRPRNSETVVVLAVDRRSSGWIYRDFATELERIRGGRVDLLPRSGVLHERHGAALKLIRVKAVDVSPPDDPEAQRAKDLLASILVEPSLADTAWAVLLESAADVAARRLRLDRAAVLDLLVGRGIAVRTLSTDERLLAQLDFVRQLLERRQAGAAISILEQFAVTLEHQQTGSEVRYWFARHRATALLQLGRNEEALASAREALAVKPNGPEALVSAAVASLQLGDIPAAQAYASSAVQSAPGSDRTWGVVAQVNAAAGEELPQPPPEIASSTHYLTVLAENAAIRGETSRVLELTARILESGGRPAEVLVYRAFALVETRRDAHEAEPATIDEVEQITTEAVEELDDVHPLKAKALILRAAVRRWVGRTDDANADLRLASNLDPDDPDVLRNLVSLRMELDDDDGALELLHRPISESDALLLAIRAEIFARRGRRPEAQRDLEHAMTLVADYHDPDAARLAIADAALEIGDHEGAARALEGLSASAARRPMTAVFEGRIAFARDDVAAAVECYRRGAEQAGALRGQFLVELAVRLAGRGRDEEALKFFGELAPASMQEIPRRSYILALVRTNNLVRAQEEVEALAGEGPLPAWATGVAVDLAFARDDQEGAIGRLAELVDRGEATTRVRIVLAHQLIEVDRRDAASAQVNMIVAGGSMTAEERMQLAELLRELGRGAEAIQQAFVAFREARDDPRMHRALSGLVFASRIDIPPTGVVGPDTHVTLGSDHGQVRAHTVLAEPPFHPSQNEISVEDAESLGLLGKHPGELVLEHGGTWQESRWTVNEIVPAVVHFAQDAIAHYEQRFPGEPFFATSIHIGDGSAPSDYTQIIRALSERRSHVDEILALLRDQQVPLGMVVRLVGGTFDDLIDILIAQPDQAAQMWVEWDDEPLQISSFDHARTALEVVLTRSALRTMNDHDLTSVVLAGYDLIAPTSLVQELRSDIRAARDEVEHGRSTMWSGDVGIRIDDIPVGDARLAARLRNLEMSLEWLIRQTRIEPRPLEWIKPDDGSPTGLRQLIGKSSYDALVLANQRNSTLYADDLGLRRLALETDRPRSFSSAALLPVLAERGLIDGSTRDTRLVDLAIHSYVAIPPTVGLLVAALQPIRALTAAGTSRVFNALWRNGVNPVFAAATIASACRAIAIDPLQTTTPAQVAELGLRAVGTRIPIRLAARLVERAASEALRLLPRELHEVRDVCERLGSRGV